MSKITSRTDTDKARVAERMNKQEKAVQRCKRESKQRRRQDSKRRHSRRRTTDEKTRPATDTWLRGRRKEESRRETSSSASFAGRSAVMKLLLYAPRTLFSVLPEVIACWLGNYDDEISPAHLRVWLTNAVPTNSKQQKDSACQVCFLSRSDSLQATSTHARGNADEQRSCKTGQPPCI